MKKKSYSYPEYMKKWKKENPDYQREWYLKNREKSIERNKKWAKLNPDKKRSNTLKCLFGITLEDYNKMLEAQNGVCAICGKEETHKNQYGVVSLSVDHDHQTGKVRGLLCSKCNKMLGLSNDNKQILLNAINYLKTKE
jgi:hypothetical protein